MEINDPEPRQAALLTTSDPLEVWAKYEDIAMHFNDLLLKLRMQALGGIAAAGAVLVAAVNAMSDGQVGLDRGHWTLVGVTLLVLFAVWVAINVLDFGYYNRLLRGTVVALLKLESGAEPGLVKLSTTIEDAVRLRRSELEGVPAESRWSSGRYWFYSIIGGLLFGGAVWAFLRGRGCEWAACLGCVAFVAAQGLWGCPAHLWGGKKKSGQ